VSKTYPYWLAVSEWLEMSEPERSFVFERHVLIGGAMKVFETVEEAFSEREKLLKDLRF
jgi:hypothetical protein